MVIGERNEALGGAELYWADCIGLLHPIGEMMSLAHPFVRDILYSIGPTDLASFLNFSFSAFLIA